MRFLPAPVDLSSPAAMATGFLGRRWMPASTVCESSSVCGCDVQSLSIATTSEIHHPNLQIAQAQMWSQCCTRSVGQFSFLSSRSVIDPQQPLITLQKQKHSLHGFKMKDLYVKTCVLLSVNTGASRLPAHAVSARESPFMLTPFENIKVSQEMCHSGYNLPRLMTSGWWNSKVQLFAAPLLCVSSLKCGNCLQRLILTSFLPEASVSRSVISGGKSHFIYKLILSYIEFWSYIKMNMLTGSWENWDRPMFLCMFFFPAFTLVQIF